MVGIAIGLLALLVTLSTFFYFGIMSVLAWKLACAGAETRRVLSMPLLPSFFQNLGVPLAILGFTFQSTEMVVLAGLMISVGMLTTSERSIALHPTIEAPMLGLALMTLGLLGLFRVML